MAKRSIKSRAYHNSTHRFVVTLYEKCAEVRAYTEKDESAGRGFVAQFDSHEPASDWYESLRLVSSQLGESVAANILAPLTRLK